MVNQGIRRATILALAIGVSGCATAPSSTVADQRERAMAAYEAGRYERAAAALRKHLDHSGNDVVAWYRLGNALARTERPERALEAYNEALRRDASHARARHNRGLLRVRLGVKDINRAQRQGGLEPGTRERTSAYLDCLLGRAEGQGSPGDCAAGSGNGGDTEGQ